MGMARVLTLKRAVVRRVLISRNVWISVKCFWKRIAQAHTPHTDSHDETDNNIASHASSNGLASG